MPVDVEMKLVADNSQAVKSVKELEQANNKLHASNEKNQKKQIGLIADVENELNKLQKAQKSAMSVEAIEKYNKKIAEAKLALEEYNKAGLAVEKQGESLLKSFGKWALGLASVATAVNLLKDAFLATETGLKTFNTVGAVTKQVLYDIVSGNKVSLAGILLSIKANKELNELRIKQRKDIVEIAKQQRVYNELYFAASDQTKTAAERLVILNQAMMQHETLMDNKIANAKEELHQIEMAIAARPEETKLLDAHAQKLAEIENMESERFSSVRRLESQRTGIEQEESRKRIENAQKETDEKIKAQKKLYDQSAQDRLDVQDYIDKIDEVYQKKRTAKAESDWDFGMEISGFLFKTNKEAAKAIYDTRIEDAEKLAELDEKTRSERIDSLKKGLSDLYDFTQEIADRELEDAQRRRELLDTRVDETQQALENEIKLYEAGYASNVALKKKELAEIKKQRDKALKEEEEAIRKQRAMENIAQGVNLFTSATNILKTYTKSFGPVGLALAAGAITAMFAIMSSAKKKSAESAFAKGGWTGIGGQRDATGERVAGVVHGEEFVVRRGQAHKFRGVLEAINRNDKKAIFNSFSKISPQGANVLIENTGPNQRLDEVNNNLKKLHNKEEIITTSIGTIIKRGNTIRTIKR